MFPYLPFDFNIIEELDTDLMEIFRKSRELLEKFPEIRESIVRDQDIHGQKKKLIRNEVKRYNDVHINGNYYLFGLYRNNRAGKTRKNRSGTFEAGISTLFSYHQRTVGKHK